MRLTSIFGSLPAIFLAAVILIPPGVNGAEIASTFVGADPGPQSATLYARRVDGVAEPAELSVSIPGSVSLPLPEGLWEVRIVGNTVWAPPLYVRHDDSTSVSIWRTAALAGTSNGVTALAVRFAATEPDGPTGEVDCEVDRMSWSCRIPAGRYDLRFVSPGTAPELRFDVDVPVAEGRIDLQFVAGASLSGRVEPARGRGIAVEGTVVSLSDRGKKDGEAYAVRADARGFFQVRGLPPGHYSLQGRKGTMATGVVPVEIIASAAAELRSPLILDTPKRLKVTITPYLDPAGAPWQLRLLSRGPRRRSAAVLAESSASDSGRWSHSNLVSGKYSLELRLSNGGIWRSEEIEVETDDLTIAIMATAEAITGRITLGGRPLVAALSFGGEGGITLQSDEDGRFSGELPPDEQQERRVLVESDRPKVNRMVTVTIARRESGEAVVEIDLPATALSGVVENEEGRPEPHAIVTISRDDLDVLQQTFTSEDGSFQLSGFEPGRYRAMAEAFGQSSQPSWVDLARNDVTQVTLRLQRQTRLRGRMVIGETPVIGAEIHALPRDRWSPVGMRTTTDEGGLFELSLPPGTTIYDGCAIHPAFDIVIGRGTIDPARRVVVRTNQIGGTLIVESEAAGNYLVMHNEAKVPLGWLAVTAGGSVERERVRVPRLQPGHYAVCLTEMTDCMQGYLPPFGTLTLTTRRESQY
jgi:hypothetical protein